MNLSTPIGSHSARNPNIAGMLERSPAAIPNAAEDITTAWLNQVLEPHLRGHRVLGSQARPYSEPGQTAEIVELWLHYDSADCPLPERMIAKLAANDQSTRDLCRTFRMYEREAGFYRDFGDAGLPIAQCFHADHDPVTQDTVIVLEHLAPSYCPSYGISPEQVRVAIAEAARLHAKYWNDRFVLDYPGLVQLDDIDHFTASAKASKASIDRVQQLVGDNCAHSVEAIMIYGAKLEAILAHARTRPFTLQHSDYHVKQVFVPGQGNHGKFAIIDFQFSVAGPGAWDISRLINFGLGIAARRETEAGLFDHYLAALASHGVTGYDRAALALDHKIGTLISQVINFTAVGQTDVALLERECAAHGGDWIDIWLLRGEAMIRDLDVLSFLRAL